MFFDQIIHGTQYYRAPTPLPEEWEGDISQHAEFGLDAMQIRINWRWNERREREYDFSDLDRLLELAKKYNRKVIMKFLLECAPQYVFEKYEGTRIGPKGEQIRPGSHGAFYGGWMPCFTNPGVQAAARRFVETVTERYWEHPNIVLWNTWNEIRNRPVEECFCPHCRAAFGRYLKGKFGTIENLNSFYHTAEESFETINLPSMPHGYWDIFEYKKFKGSAELYNYVRFVYDGIRKYDRERPIMCHVGITSAFQTGLGDVCDDHTVSKAVDFWGTSMPSENLREHKGRINFFLLEDFLRSVSEFFFNHEIYPGLGMFREYDAPEDLNFKQMAALASGSRGIVYWQYRAERLGMENDCAGLMRMDGSPRPVAYEVQRFGELLHRDREFLVNARAEKAQMAIVHDFNSQLMAEIEDSCGDLYAFIPWGTQMCYHKALTGAYRMARKAGYSVDFTSVTKPEAWEQYKLLYFPYYTMLDPELVPVMERFLEKGGVIIADEGFGMRTGNTWMQPYDLACKPILTARLRERRWVEKTELTCRGRTVPVGPYRTDYRVEGGETVLTFPDGSPAVQMAAYGKGRIYLCGFDLGASFWEWEDPVWMDCLKELAEELGIEPYAYGNQDPEIYEKRLTGEGYQVVFLFNNAAEPRQVKLAETVLRCSREDALDGNVLTLAPHRAEYVIVEK